MKLRPVREITAEEENFRLEPIEGLEAQVVRRNSVEPEPVGTYVVCVFKITGYDADCDGQLMARLEQVNKDGQTTGWTETHLGLYPDSNLVVESPSMLWENV